MQSQELTSKREAIKIEIRRKVRQTHINSKRVANIELQEVQNDKLTRVWQKRTYAMRDFDKLTEFIRSNDPEKTQEGLWGMKKLFNNQQNTSMKKAHQIGLFQDFITLYRQNDFGRIKKASLECLINVSTAETSICNSLLSMGIIEVVFESLRGNASKLRLDEIWVIANLSTESVKVRDIVLDLGIINFIIELFNQCTHEKDIDILIWALANVCRGNPPPNYEKTKAALPVFIETLLSQQNQGRLNVITQTLWALSYIVQSSGNANKHLVKGGMIPKIGEYLRCPALGILVPSLRILGNLLSGTTEEQVASFQPCTYQPLLPLLNHQRKCVRKQVMWVISNMAAGTQQMVNIILNDERLLTKILEAFTKDSVQVRKQAAWVFQNIIQTICSYQTVRVFNHLKVIDGFVFNLRNNTDTQLLLELVLGLDKILSYGQALRVESQGNLLQDMFDSAGGKEALLQIHAQSSDVWTAAQHVLQKYYTPLPE